MSHKLTFWLLMRMYYVILEEFYCTGQAFSEAHELRAKGLLLAESSVQSYPYSTAKLFLKQPAMIDQIGDPLLKTLPCRGGHTPYV